MNRQTVGFCHPWYKSLGVVDDILPKGRIPSCSDNSLGTDMQDDTDTLLVEVGVELV